MNSLSVLGFSVVFTILPAPADIVISFGFAILETEFLWVGKLLHPIKKILRRPKVCIQRVLHRLHKKREATVPKYYNRPVYSFAKSSRHLL